jgi:hypothetical protein
MAKLKLSELPVVASKTDSDLLYLVQNGASKQITVGTLLSDIVTAGNGIVIESNGMIVANVEIPEYPNVSPISSADYLQEGFTNKYFTNTRAIVAVKDNINTSNIGEGSNLYFTNVRAIAAVKDNINTSNVVEGDNLYFTNTRARDVFTAGQNITIANGEISASISDLEAFNSDNLAEGDNHQYFTNTRVVAALTAGPGVHIDANGMISFNSGVLLGGTQNAGILLDSVTQIIDSGELNSVPTQLIDYGTI